MLVGRGGGGTIQGNIVSAAEDRAFIAPENFETEEPAPLAPGTAGPVLGVTSARCFGVVGTPAKARGFGK